MDEEATCCSGGGRRNGLFTFELQLKTFPSMIASDLYHNVIYKNLLPQSSASMADTIKRYAWQNVYSEITSYYTTNQLKVEEVLSPMASSLSSSFSSSSSATVASALEQSTSTFADMLQPLPSPLQSSSPPPVRTHSASNHFKRKSIEKCVTDPANLMQQLFNSKTYR
jgi:hypothetical protein